MEENMRNRFDRQLSTLNDELIEMGSMIEKSIETAIKALVNQDVDLARHAIVQMRRLTVRNVLLKTYV